MPKSRRSPWRRLGAGPLAAQDGAIAYADPRLAALGFRLVLPKGDLAALGCDPASEADYHAIRISHGVPEGGRDYGFGEAFPHEALFDQLNGVDFAKGCYVGQEVVSRMEHRGTARKRIVPVEGEAPLPLSGTNVEADGVAIGTLGSVSGSSGLALHPSRPGRGGLGQRQDAYRRRGQDRAAASVLRAFRRARCRGPGMTGGAVKRCPWPGTDPLYVAYHDEEWGVPERDDRALYEKLVLDGFQAGLSWITILRKREAFRRAFDGFAPEKIARYSSKKVEALMQDQGIVRNRMKIEGAVASARAWLEIMEGGPGFGPYLWDFVGGKPIVNRHKTMAEVPRRDRAVARPVKGPQGARLQILRSDDYLCLHAGNRHGQRPLDRLCPTCGVRKAWTRFVLAAAARIHAARIGALFLDLAVALSDANRAHAFDGSLQDPALGGRRLGGKPLDDLPRAFVLQLPLLGLVVMRRGNI